MSATYDSTEGIRKISEVISNVRDIVTEVTSAVEEQASVVGEINTNIDQMASGITEILVNMDESKHAMNAVAADIAVVSSKATENKDQSTKIKFKSEEILAISRELGELATSSISSESN